MSFLKNIKRSYNRNFWHSVNFALEGIIHTLKSERNMRIHFIVGFFVIIAGICFDLTSVEMMILLFATSFVLVAEMFNTAIEYLADAVSGDEYHPAIKVVKDITAGAVFVSAINAGLTGYILVVNRLNFHTGKFFFKIRNSHWHTTLIALIACIGIVLLIIRREKDLLRGGMPSGHTAAAFAIWMAVSLITLNSLVSVLVFFLAFIVARSRLYSGIHKTWEVVAGGLLGALVTLLIFQVIS